MQYLFADFFILNYNSSRCWIWKELNMKIKYKNNLQSGKNIIIFFVGVVFVRLLTQLVMSTNFPEMIKKITQEEIQDFVTNLDGEIFSVLIKIYIISFILFALLPDKIRKSSWYLRVIYFVIFYFFCILVYLWI